MKAAIMNYRRGRHTQTPNQALLAFPGVDSRAKAAELEGKRVVWKTTSGKSIVGKITLPHGSKGIVRARFVKGLPGTAIGGLVQTVEATKETAKPKTAKPEAK